MSRNENPMPRTNVGFRIGSWTITFQSLLLIGLDIFILLIAYPHTKTKLLLLMGSLLFVFLIIGIVLTLIFPIGLSIERKIVGTAMVELGFTLNFIVHNSGLDKLGFMIYDFIPPLHTDVQLQEFAVGYLSRGSSLQYTYRVTPIIRGDYTLESVFAKGGDPFGLFQRYIRLNAPGRLLVLPRPQPVYSQLPTSVSIIPFEEMSTVNLSGNSSEFMGVREYQNGDSPKRIHWLASAKRGQLITRLYERNVAGSLSIVLLNNSQNDRRNPQAEHPIEYQIKLAANLAQAAVDQQYIMQLATVSPIEETITRGTGQGVLQEWLHVLARLKDGAPFDVAKRTGDIISQLMPPVQSDQAGLLIIISSGLLKDEQLALGLIAHRMRNTTLVDIVRSSFSTNVTGKSRYEQIRDKTISSTNIKRLNIFKVKAGDNLSSASSMLLLHNRESST